MPNGSVDQKIAVLYVDDEEQSLKYFHKSYRKDFRVLTASSVAEARRVLDREGDSVGVVMSDQRMPDKTGVDLLSHLRQDRPDIVRILTTAYCDVESAIDAVNSGAIYKYIVKPWDHRRLRGTLQRAAESFVVQRERNALFREKLSVIRRIIVIDRVQSLAALSASLSHQMRNSMQALLCFIDMAPAKLREELPDSALRNPEFWRDLWSLARKDAGRILQMLEQVALTVAEPDCRSVEEAELTDVLAGAAIAASDTIGAGRVVLDVAPGLPRITADLAMLRRLFITLIGRVAKMSAVDGKINVSAHNVITVWGTPGVRIFVAGQGRAWTDAETGSVFAAFGAACEIRELGLDMLGAFSIVFHHGGDIAVHKSAPAGPGFEVRLPLGLARAEGPGFGDKLLERLFTHFDAAGDAPRA